MSRRRMGPIIPKVCGADVELGNFVAGTERLGGTGPEASRALLGAIVELTQAVPALRNTASSRFRRSAAVNAQDSGRVFLPTNGGCVYIDLDHLELCLPEVVSAFDHVAAWHAMLRLAQAGLTAANADRDPDRRVQAMVNNCDGRGNSYGGHLNIAMTRRAWDAVMRRKLHYLAYLASYQASSLVFTGQGKTGSENDRPEVSYQISQRADFIETMLGPQTTFFRPLINTRDEPHSGEARLHLISFDSTLCPVASLLRVGVTQLVLTMIEADRVNPRLALDDPLAAFQDWSCDPLLEHRAPLVNGKRVSAVELQLRFLDEARRFAEQVGFETVPRATEILDCWQETLDGLTRRDWPMLARRLDWVMKLAMLERAKAQRPELAWDSPELRYLDQLFGALDPDSGLFWAWSRAGLVEAVVPDERIRHFEAEPPPDTRAWGRAMLLRTGGPDTIDQVDWSTIRFRPQSTRPACVVDMLHPLSATREHWKDRFTADASLENVLAELGAERVPNAQATIVLPGPRGLVPGVWHSPVTQWKGDGDESA